MNNVYVNNAKIIKVSFLILFISQSPNKRNNNHRMITINALKSYEN